MQATVNGVRIAFAEQGSGTPLVFVHGFPLCRATWSKQVAAFKAQHRVITPDLRGLGESEATLGPVTMQRYAEDVHALLQHLGVGPVVLAGHSMGGYVALAFAKAFPQMLKGLVLVATRAGADTPEAAAGRRATAAQVQAQGSAVVVDAMAPKMLDPANTDREMLDAVRGFMAPSKPEGVIGALLGMAERPDARSWLPHIHVPTLVITGAGDAVFPASESEAMAHAIPGARLAILPHAGHLVAYEQADAFNRALEHWLHEI